MDGAICSKHIISGYNWINKELVGSDSFIKKHILARVGYVGLTPAHLICGVIDTIIGLGSLFVSIFSSNEEILEFSAQHLDQSSKIISYIHLNVLNILNPKISVIEKKDKCTPFLEKEYSTPNDLTYGIITYRLTPPIGEYIDKLNDSENCLAKYAGGLSILLLRTILFVATRSIDLLIGLTLIPFSLLIAATNIECLNKRCIRLHRAAFRGVQLPAIAIDLLFLLTLTKNMFKTRKQKPDGNIHYEEIIIEQTPNENHDN